MTAIKLKVGLEMLSEARLGEFESASATVNKLLGNILANPAEPKFRKIRTTNPKISLLLSTRGIRAILIGAGFAEEGEFLVLPDDAPTDAINDALAGLAAQASERAVGEQAMKAQLIASRQEAADKENEERKRMRDGIADDAAARKEPGWKAKAAGVKDGRAIVGCSDVGIGANSGG